MGSGSFLKVLAKNFDVLAGYGLLPLPFPSPFLALVQGCILARRLVHWSISLGGFIVAAVSSCHGSAVHVVSLVGCAWGLGFVAKMCENLGAVDS
ncbi:unnamed protein product [Triticum turgidum subsp. durum]|uniref:Uncharacterized protein n=1 Tax=Triticum turgidum subsp. durum TaxID=4567 RepID=A0A9R0Z826_TRITD|nr:unnamed protein product [Triticum turgidum subsp. durum]